MERTRAVAVAAVRDACGLCRRVAAGLGAADAMDKRDRSPVTVADFGAQAVVAERLAGAGGGIPLVAEEDAAGLREPGQAGLRARVVEQVGQVLPGVSEGDVLAAIDAGGHGGGGRGRFWTLDPIDGTKGFLRGDQYAVALALVEDGEVVLGVLGCPNLPVRADDPGGARGCLFAAVRGRGAVQYALDADDGQPVRVSAVARAADAAFCESVESGHTRHGEAGAVAARLGVTRPPFRIDSQCKYAAIARGDAAVYLRLPTRADYEEKIWDHAAGSLLVAEAGGCVTDTRGRPLDFARGRTLAGNRGVVASNGRFHDEVVAAVGAVLGAGPAGGQ